ncbi:FHA domain-containing protein [Salinibacterium sp. ZJ77]|uniref:FHA domain-containing protein n=1 Tax=Salinibacterium sp. ZJ77 TaxID=2708337 RepID=UPI00141F61E3|nr:FHA domain-containing protein [Salinibacterium sp. ZJ77]
MTTCRFCGSDLPDSALLCGECGRSTHPDDPQMAAGPLKQSEAPPAPRTGGPPSTPPVLWPRDTAVVPTEDEWDTYQSLDAPPPLPQVSGERFTLQFSTGESIVVAGSGLIGRGPSPEPGEYVDHLIPIFDVGRSMSKTHVEFGQESGSFWVSDRYSTNGTLVRRPGTEPARCVPGRRCFVERGTRVEMGDQFFIVS